MFIRIGATCNQFGLDGYNLIFVLLLVFLGQIADYCVKMRFGASSFLVELNGVSVTLLFHGIFGNTAPNLNKNRSIRLNPSLLLAEDNLQIAYELIAQNLNFLYQQSPR